MWSVVACTKINTFIFNLFIFYCFSDYQQCLWAEQFQCCVQGTCVKCSHLSQCLKKMDICTKNS